jgi:hypothetical protein
MGRKVAKYLTTTELRNSTTKFNAELSLVPSMERITAIANEESKGVDSVTSSLAAHMLPEFMAT